MSEAAVVGEGTAPLHLTYDAALPITAWHDEIAGLIRDHPVVVVAGETGSGKTTQLPKICLELGRRSIAHTQPRRLAARTVAQRVAEELQTTLGELVGYQVRFTRQTSRQTRLKIMTDGVLLAEIGRDRDLRRYDTIIVDEAHERSLNIDFLLGYLRQLLGRRPDLRVVITSATIDTARFAEHFAGPDGTPAPVVEVSGRTYPVEMRYRPLLEDGTVDQNTGIVDAVRELSALGGGDILVFCSGEREIRDAADALAGASLRFTEVLPLYARLSSAEQHRIFTDHPGRRVVLATNVAETSLTVPGIRYVVDVGTARISRYSARTKVQRLPIEPVSQASANQRAGRCGRVAPGVCIRLYSEEDYASRPLFTEPEILRTNLASVILQMAAAELGDIASFPFVEAPDRTQVTDGLRLLTELGAVRPSGQDGARRGRVDGEVRLTKIGQRLAALPVDPRMGRMLLAAEREGCLAEMLVIVAGLSIPDPRERPAEQRERAEALHRRFWAPLPSDRRLPTQGVGSALGQPAGADADAKVPSEGSDFLALLRLWDYLKASRKELSGNAFRRRVREEFLHYLRVREWQDLHTQLKQACKDLGMGTNDQPAGPDAIHTSALAGLLSHVGLLDEREEPKPARGAKPAPKRRRASREYLGARGTRFVIGGGSAAAGKPPPLVVAAEIVETSRLYARTVAGVTAGQVEQVAEHLVNRQYSEPHWSSRSAAVLAYEQVTLYGVPIVSRRRVGYARVDPVEARAIFLRAALVEGLWHTRHRFLARNAEVRAEVEELEERTRRRDLTVDDDTIFAFYDARVPADVTSGAAFDAWWKNARQQTPELLDLTLDDLTTGQPGVEMALGITAAYPDHWDVAGHAFPTTYRFAPGDARDGVTVTIPLDVLNQVPPGPFTWQVPGLRLELATELVRSLPRALRRLLVPAPEHAQRALTWVREHPGPAGEALPAALGRAVRGLTGEVVPVDAWDVGGVPDHLRVGFVVTDAAGEPVAEGKDLAALKTRLAAQVSEALASTADTYTRRGITRWDLGRLEPELTVSRDGRTVVGYPALVDEQTSVTLTLLDTPARQAAANAAGLRRLVLLGTPDPTRWVVAHLSNLDKLALGSSPYSGVPALLGDARLAAVGELVRRNAGTAVRDADAFTRLCDAVRMDLPDLTRDVVALAAEVLRVWGALQTVLPTLAARNPDAAADLREQLANLVFPGFLSATAYEHLVDLPRYLQAAQQRVATLQTQPTRDATALATVLRCEDAYAALVAEVPPGPLPPAVAEVGWLLEELRVSLFAQGLRTKVPVSEKRVLNAIHAARTAL